MKVCGRRMCETGCWLEWAERKKKKEMVRDCKR